MKYIILIAIIFILLLLVLFLNFYQTKLIHDTKKASKKSEVPEVIKSNCIDDTREEII